MENEKIKTVPEFISFIGQMHEKELLSYIMRQVLFGENSFNESLVCWEDCEHISGKTKQLILDMDDKTNDEKGKLLECMDNPEETKQRLSFFFKQFYEKSYLQVESIVLNEIKEAEKQYKKIMESNPEEFITKYFFNFFKIENKSWNYKLNIHLSLFLNIYFWTVNLHDYKEKQGWVVIGIRTYKFFYQKEAFEKVDRFLKVLGDKRRVDIVKMLSYKPYYGYEIAAKLELTPATVNYHINLLMDAGILTFDREENKVYYTLNKDRVKELLNETSMMLINEPLK
jgi:DNA-binding transcriptional ArsR family regulator